MSMNIDNETAEEKAIREEKERNQIPDEVFEAELKKRFGAGSSELIVKTAVLSDEDKKKLDAEKKEKAFTTGLEQKWFKKEDYDDFQQLTAKGKVEIAKKMFIEENPDLGEDAESTFNELFLVNEDDEIEENETMQPNKRKKVAISLAEKMADQYVAKRFDPILKVEERYDKHEKFIQTGKVNLATIEKTIMGIPDEIEIDLGVDGFDKIKFKVTEEDKKSAATLFMNDRELVRSEKINEAEVRENGILKIKADNLERIVSEAVISAVTKARQSYERGEKGIIPVRKENNDGSLGIKERFLQSKGIALPGK